MNYYHYEDLHIGQKEEFSVEISEQMLESFENISGDNNLLHKDDEFAKAHGYQQKVVYGMLTSSFLSTLGGVYLPGAYCLIQSVETKFIHPVFVGDKLLVTGTVIELNDSVRQIVLSVTITNQDDRKVLRGKMKMGLIE